MVDQNYEKIQSSISPEPELTPEQELQVEQLLADNPSDEAKPSPKYPDDKPFNQSIINSLLTNKLILESSIGHNCISPDYFEDKAHKFLAKTAIEFFNKYQELPPRYHLDHELQEHIKDEETRKYYNSELDECLNIETPPHQYLWDRAIKFDRKQRYTIAALNLISEGSKPNPDWQKIAEGFADAAKPRVLQGNFLLNGQQLLDAQQGYDWVIDGALYRGAVVLLSASQGDGKTVLLVQSAASCIYEAPVFGRQTKRTPHIYLDWDAGGEHFKDNVRVAIKGRNPELFWQHFFYASNAPDYPWQQPLPSYLSTEFLDALVKDFPEPGVIYVDALRPAFCNTPGKLPNNWLWDAITMTKLMDPFRAWAHKTKWVIVFIHHDNKQGGISASEAICACSDIIWKYDRPQGGDKSTLKISKRIPNEFTCNFEFKNRIVEYQGDKKATDGKDYVAMAVAITEQLGRMTDSETGTITSVQEKHPRKWGRDTLSYVIDSLQKHEIVETKGKGRSTTIALSVGWNDCFETWKLGIETGAITIK